MGITVSHQLSATTPDDPGYEIQPQHWNQSHAFTLNAVGSEISNAFGNGGGVTFGLSADGKITASAPAGGGGLTNINVSAGTTSNNLSALTFDNGNGVTFGLNASTLTASVNTSYRASNDAVGLNTALTAGPLAWTVNSAGISLNAGSAAGTTSGFGGNLISGSMTHNTAGLNLSLNHPAWLTTAMQSNAATISNIRVSAGTTSNLLSALTFDNGNGITFGLNASTLTASHNGLTTARASNDAIGLNTAQSNVTWTVNSAGLSLDARGYAGTTTGFTGTNVSATMTLNSAGIALQLSGQGGGVINQTGPNIAAGTQTATSGTVVFSNSNNMTFGMSDSSVVTASFNAINLGVSTGGNTAGTTGTIEGAGGQYLLVGGNGITLSQSTNGAASGTVTIQAGMNTQRFQWPPGNFTAVAAIGNGSFSINRMQADAPISATRLEVPFLVSLASSAANNTWGFAATVFGAIYTKNVSTLSSLSSGSTSFSFSLASNTAGQTQVIAHAIRPYSIPINVNMSVGEYYVGMGISTNTSSAGTATTALGITQSVMGGPIYSSAVGQVAEFTATTNTSTGIWGGQGIYSAAISTVPPAVSLSAINQTGSHYARANFAAIFRNI